MPVTGDETLRNDLANGVSQRYNHATFYSGDSDEPPHIHVEREYMKAKFWLDPVRLHRSGGFSRSEINRIQRLVEENREYLLRSWNEFSSD